MKKIFLALCALAMSLLDVSAQNNSASSKNQQVPIGSVLNSDGTLNLKSGFSGTLNPDGWKMETGPRGEPRFTRIPRSGTVGSPQSRSSGMSESASRLPRTRVSSFSPDDVRWKGGYEFGGIVGEVYAVAVHGTDVYVGGQFSLAGGTPASNIAKWNGTTWSALGMGVDGWIQALIFVGDNLYAGGRFWNAGGVAANNIAKWNGTSWSALGGGTGYTVYALATDGTDLFVAGDFSDVANTPGEWITVNYVAKWNGTIWSALGSGMSFRVHALSFMGGDLYAGGWFTIAGGVTANQIAKWNGTSWSSLGAGAANGTNSGVFALTNDGSTLYVGGTFTEAGGAPANYVATWNGTSWGTLGSGAGDEVYALQLFDGYLYAGGDFDLGEGGPKYAMKWDGESWSSVLDEGGGGPDGTVYGFAATEATLYAVTDGKPNVQQWSGSMWLAVAKPTHHGLDGRVRALLLHNGNLYAGGDFTTADGIRVNHIAKWDGFEWSAIGYGLAGPVYALLVHDNILYAGFADGVARWYDGFWESVGAFSAGGEDNPAVYALSASDNRIYVGGKFTKIDGITMNNIAQWDASTESWSPLVGVFSNGVGGRVYALNVIADTLYVGGNFSSMGGADIVSHIAKWDGSAWSTLGGSANAPVFAFATMGNVLYAAGQFTTIGGLATSPHLAKWDGTAWSSVGNGTNGDVYALATNGSHLYVGGDFFTTDPGLESFMNTSKGVADVSANNIALWTGSSWSALGSGLDAAASVACRKFVCKVARF